MRRVKRRGIVSYTIHALKQMKSIGLEKKIGQLFIIGFAGDRITDDHPIARDISQRNLGGVILFDKFLAISQSTNNIVNAHQLGDLIRSLQELAETPLLVAVDQEGGRVSRFKEKYGFPATPAASELGNRADVTLTRDSGRQTAEMLASIGVNFNLAPVVDLNVYKDNPIIGKYGRSFSGDAKTVTSHAAAWIEEHQRLGILSCLKHFPGHGSSRSDSHLGFVDITKSWQEVELQPFEQLIQKNYADAIMIGHLIHRNFDKEYPATLSRTIIQSLLRNRLQYDGVIISDDMQMKAITDHYGLEDACCRAISAGVDLLIIGNNLDHDPNILSKLQTSILKGLDNGIVTEDRIERAYCRVQKLKQFLAKTHAEQ